MSPGDITTTTRSGGHGRHRSCLLPQWPSSSSPSTRAKLPRAGLAPQLEQRHWGLISTCWILQAGSDQRAKARHCEKYVPRENLLRTAFQTWSFIILFMPKSVLYNHERERERQRVRERERERVFPGGKEELIKKREEQDHAFTLKSWFTSKPTFLTLQPLIYICLLSN